MGLLVSLCLIDEEIEKYLMNDLKRMKLFVYYNSSNGGIATIALNL